MIFPVSVEPGMDGKANITNYKTLAYVMLNRYPIREFSLSLLAITGETALKDFAPNHNHPLDGACLE